MAATQRFQLVVEAQARGGAELARLSATVNKLGDELARANKKISDDAVKNQVRYSDAMKRMKQDSESSLGGASKVTSDGAAGLGRYATAALGVYAAVKTAAAGFDTFIRGAGEAALEIKSLSLSTGLTIGQADKLRAAANLTGFDIRNLKEAALDLSVALKDTGGQGDQTRQLLKQLGVSAFTSTGQTRALNDVLLETFDALSKVTDTTQRVNLSRVLGGEDAAKTVQPLLAGYREANQLAEQLGFGTREGLLKALDDSNKQLRAFDLQWEIIKGKLAEKIAPVIVPILLRVSRLAAGDTSALPGSAFSKGAQDAENEVLAKMFPTIDGGAALSRLAPSTPGLDTGGLTAGAAMSDRFRRGQLGGENGIKARLEQIAKDRATINGALLSGKLGKSAFESQFKELQRIESEQRALNLRLAGLNNAEAIKNSISDLELSKSGNEDPLVKSLVERSRFVAGLTAQGGSTAQQLRAYTAFDSQMSTALASRPGSATFNLGRIGIGTKTRYGNDDAVAGGADFGAFNGDTGAAEKVAELQRQKDIRERELNTSFARQFVQFEERKIEMLTGPGGELAAIQEIYDLKTAGLQQELDYGNEIFDLTQRRLQIEQDRTLAILNLQRQRKDEARGLASDFVGSLQDGRPQDFFRQQGGRLLNQVGTNALTGTFQRVQSTLGRVGAASGLGGLLKGTLLDPSNATPLDKTAAATERTAIAAERTANAVEGRGFITAGGTTATLPSGFNAIGALGPASGLFGNTVSGKVGQITGGAASALAPGGLFAGVRGGSIQLGNGQATTAEGLGLTTTASRTANVAGSIATIGIGAKTAYDGFKRGGAAGITQGIAATLGTAALIPGPQQPFIAAAAATAALVGMLLPDPKKARDAAINRGISEAFYGETAPMAFSMDRLGRSYDTNKRGDIRAVPIQININALDSKSIIDARESIADALRLAVYEGHGINRAMQEAVGAA